MQKKKSDRLRTFFVLTSVKNISPWGHIYKNIINEHYEINAPRVRVRFTPLLLLFMQMLSN